MPTKTIILHVGYPKTGTSSLQWFLHTHRDRLREQGVCYPLTGQAVDHAHHTLAFSLGANAGQPNAEQQARLFRDLASEIDRCDAATVVLSSEVLLGNLEYVRASRELAGILDGRVLRVICFVRRQATFLESLYRQFIWDPDIRFAGSPDAFVDAYPVAGDYHAPLSVWAGWVGRENVITVVYEQAQRAEGCIKRFCRLVGIHTARLPEVDFNIHRNVAVAPRVATDLMRAGNGHTHLSDDERTEFARRAREFAELTKSLPLPKGLFTPDEVARIEARFLDSNRRLASDFVGQPLDGFWFREAVDA